jgi:hypothetical protein
MGTVNQDNQDNQDTAQAYTLTTKEMAKDLQVEPRTILRYINQGYTALDGTTIALPARLKRGGKGGPAWHARPADYQDFKLRILQAEQNGQARHNGQTSATPAGATVGTLPSCDHQEALRQALTSIVHLSASIETLTRRLDHLEATIEQIRTPKPRRPRQPRAENAATSPDPSVTTVPAPPAPTTATSTTDRMYLRPGCLTQLTHRLVAWKGCITTVLKCLKNSQP